MMCNFSTARESKQTEALACYRGQFDNERKAGIFCQGNAHMLKSATAIVFRTAVVLPKYLLTVLFFPRYFYCYSNVIFVLFEDFFIYM